MHATREVLHKHNNFTGWVILLATLWFFVPSFVMPLVWMDLRSVTVSDVVYPGIPQVEADRVIHNDFLGTYSVIVRNTDRQTVLCEGRSGSAFEYRAAASQTNPLVMSLERWWGETIPPDCIQNLRPGHYSVTTCHTVYFPWRVPVARRCVESNVFTVVAS